LATVKASLDATLVALADPTRRRIVHHLRRGPCRAGDLAQVCEMSPPALSRHLRVLRGSGLVAERAVEDDARVRLYVLRPQRLAELRRWLDEVESLWSAQLDAFKAHVEARPRRRR
jgi:DNA-binding transcriptional ArsR family regulator